MVLRAEAHTWSGPSISSRELFKGRIRTCRSQLATVTGRLWTTSTSLPTLRTYRSSLSISSVGIYLVSTESSETRKLSRIQPKSYRTQLVHAAHTWENTNVPIFIYLIQIQIVIIFILKYWFSIFNIQFK